MIISSSLKKTGPLDHKVPRVKPLAMRYDKAEQYNAEQLAEIRRAAEAGQSHKNNIKNTSKPAFFNMKIAKSCIFELL